VFNKHSEFVTMNTKEKRTFSFLMFATVYVNLLKGENL